MGTIATFNYETWITRYPEFKDVTAELAKVYFDEATLYHRNDGTGSVDTVETQLTLLNMLTAHIAAQYVLPDGSPAPSNSPVGRVSSASEGSVSASMENNYKAGSPQWFQTTKYGSAYWNVMKAYRTVRYRANPSYVGGYPFGRYYGRGGW